MGLISNNINKKYNYPNFYQLLYKLFKINYSLKLKKQGISFDISQ